MKVAFRVDVNEHIATGHAVRCMAIAEQVVKRGDEAVFIVSDNISSDFITNRGFDGIVLDTRWDDKESEVTILRKCLSDDNVGVLLVDSYQATPRYLELLQGICKIAYIDDYTDHALAVQYLIRYDIGCDAEFVQSLYTKKETALLLGTRFAPLRSQFQDVKYCVDDHVSNLLILTGGTNPCNYAEKIIERLIEDNILSSVIAHLVVGEYAICNITNSNLVIHRNVKNMAELMRGCDIAISAAGTTTYELCACGVPTVTFTLADNQMANAIGFDLKGVIPYAGDMRDDREACLESMSRYVRRYITDKGSRREHSGRMRACVDGNGAMRIAQAIGGGKR